MTLISRFEIHNKYFRGSQNNRFHSTRHFLQSPSRIFMMSDLSARFLPFLIIFNVSNIFMLKGIKLENRWKRVICCLLINSCVLKTSEQKYWNKKNVCRELNSCWLYVVPRWQTWTLARRRKFRFTLIASHLRACFEVMCRLAWRQSCFGVQNSQTFDFEAWNIFSLISRNSKSYDVTVKSFPIRQIEVGTWLSPQSSHTHSFIQDESLTNCWQAFGWQLGCPSRVCHTFRLLDRLFSLIVAAAAAVARKVVLIYGTFENSSIALDSSRLALEWDEGLNDGLGKNI